MRSVKEALEIGFKFNSDAFSINSFVGTCLTLVPLTETVETLLYKNIEISLVGLNLLESQELEISNTGKVYSYSFAAGLVSTKSAKRSKAWVVVSDDQLTLPLPIEGTENP